MNITASFILSLFHSMSGSRYDVLYLSDSDSDSDSECTELNSRPTRHVHWSSPLVTTVSIIPNMRGDTSWKCGFEWEYDDAFWDDLFKPAHNAM